MIPMADLSELLSSCFSADFWHGTETPVGICHPRLTTNTFWLRTNTQRSRTVFYVSWCFFCPNILTDKRTDRCIQILPNVISLLYAVDNEIKTKGPMLCTCLTLCVNISHRCYWYSSGYLSVMCECWFGFKPDVFRFKKVGVDFDSCRPGLDSNSSSSALNITNLTRFWQPCSKLTNLNYI